MTHTVDRTNVGDQGRVHPRSGMIRQLVFWALVANHRVQRALSDRRGDRRSGYERVGNAHVDARVGAVRLVRLAGGAPGGGRRWQPGPRGCASGRSPGSVSAVGCGRRIRHAHLDLRGDHHDRRGLVPAGPLLRDGRGPDHPRPGPARHRRHGCPVSRCALPRRDCEMSSSHEPIVPTDGMSTAGGQPKPPRAQAAGCSRSRSRCGWSCSLFFKRSSPWSCSPLVFPSRGRRRRLGGRSPQRRRVW